MTPEQVKRLLRDTVPTLGSVLDTPGARSHVWHCLCEECLERPAHFTPFFAALLVTAGGIGVIVGVLMRRVLGVPW